MSCCVYLRCEGGEAYLFLIFDGVLVNSVGTWADFGRRSNIRMVGIGGYVELLYVAGGTVLFYLNRVKSLLYLVFDGTV